MMDKLTIMSWLEGLAQDDWRECHSDSEVQEIARQTLAMLKEQEPVEPTINEYGEAYCICGENVGIIPSSKNLPSVRSKYCSECGRRIMWK